MATVNVHNWAEFVEAVAVAGDTVIMPEAERWDMNVIAPEGISEGITVNCAKIVGNGTSIWNAHFYERIAVSGTEITDLHFINFLSNKILFDTSNNTAFERCMFSGLLGSNRLLATGNVRWNRCSANVESQSDNSGASGQDVFGNSCTYCRIIYHVANIGIIRFSTVTNCEFILYAPQATKVYIESINSTTIRGNLSSCTYVGYYSNKYGSAGNVVNTDDLADGAELKIVAGVTDAQMKDAAYLASVGFPIGGGDDP